MFEEIELKFWVVLRRWLEIRGEGHLIHNGDY